MKTPEKPPRLNSIAISVVVPVRDEEDSIRALLDGLLGQTRPPDEIVITDGGSVDQTRAIVQEFIRRGMPVKLLTDDDSLPGRGRNIGVRNASNDWIAFVDAGVRPTATWLQALADKIIKLRIFRDDVGKMNRSLAEINGAMLVVSQFTLYGDARKGRRPSYIDAAEPERANALYEYFVSRVRDQAVAVSTGIFQAMMQVHLVNDGPVTILLDSRKLF